MYAWYILSSDSYAFWDNYMCWSYYQAGYVNQYWRQKNTSKLTTNTGEVGNCNCYDSCWRNFFECNQVVSLWSQHSTCHKGKAEQSQSTPSHIKEPRLLTPVITANGTSQRVLTTLFRKVQLQNCRHGQQEFWNLHSSSSCDYAADGVNGIYRTSQDEEEFKCNGIYPTSQDGESFKCFLCQCYSDWAAAFAWCTLLQSGHVSQGESAPVLTLLH